MATNIIIKKEDLPVINKEVDPKDFHEGDYITDTHNEDFYVIDKIETVENSNGRPYTRYYVTQVNPLTLEREENTERFSDYISDDSMREYYRKLSGDVTKLRDVSHRIIFENATIEDISETQNTDETALMALSDKQSLIAVRSQLDEARRSVEVVQQYCNIMTARIRKDLEKKIRGVQGVIKVMQKEIEKFDYVIQTIETYAGISEEVSMIIDGEPALEDTTIVIRQGVLFVDEELALIEDDFDWQKMDRFDEWLKVDGNFKKILPDEKSIVAIKPRRTNKTYSTNDNFYNYVMDRPNHQTLFLIRNGERLYRLESEHISLEDRLFPNEDEYMKKLEEEQKHPSGFQSKTTEVMRKRFTKVAFLLQGLLDRSDVFSPHNVKCSFLKMDGIDGESIKMEYELDTSHLLGDGRPTLKDWIEQTNSKVHDGSRIVLLGEGAMGDFLRYYNRGCEPEKPEAGIYTLKKNPKYDKNASYHCDYYDRPYIISYVPFGETYSWTEGFKERKNKISICLIENSRSWLAYDELNIDDLDYYLNSRLYRSQYYSFVQLFKTAKRLIQQEQAEEEKYALMLSGELYLKNYKAKDGELKDVAWKAIDIIKKRLKWKRPITSKEKETYTLIHRTLFSKAFVEKYLTKEEELV